MFRVALAVVAALLVIPAAAQANWELAADGQPRITLNVFNEGANLFTCPPGGAPCAPVTPTGAVYEPGATAAGTTFEFRKNGAVERSPAWQGQVTNTAPPTIDGLRFMTGDARPVAGAWTGGWGDDVSRLGLAACADAAGTDCVALPALSGCPLPCQSDPTGRGVVVSGGGEAALPPSLAGRVLIATETRLPRDQRLWPVPVPALWDPQHSSALPAMSPVHVRSAPIGPLGLPSQMIVEPVPPTVSSVKLRAQALRTKGRLSLGRIECKPACKVSVKVSGGGKKARTTTFTVVSTKTIITPRRRGKLTVRVHVDGKLAANGRVTAR